MNAKTRVPHSLSQTRTHKRGGPNAIDDEDQGNEASKDVLAEHGHVLHEGTKVEERHQNGEKGAPHAGPEVERHELQVHSDAQVIDDLCDHAPHAAPRAAPGRTSVTVC